MKNENPKQLLRNPNQEPTAKLFKSILDQSICEIMKKIEQSIIITGLVLEWRYYKDGKAWLGKATYKKKTIVWISVWENFIKASFYFTEKSRPGVLDLNFNQEIKSFFTITKPVGKLIPLIVDINDEQVLQDFNLILNYKRNLLG